MRSGDVYAATAFTPSGMAAESQIESRYSPSTLVSVINMTDHSLKLVGVLTYGKIDVPIFKSAASDVIWLCEDSAKRAFGIAITNCSRVFIYENTRYAAITMGQVVVQIPHISNIGCLVSAAIAESFIVPFTTVLIDDKPVNLYLGTLYLGAGTQPPTVYLEPTRKMITTRTTSYLMVVTDGKCTSRAHVIGESQISLTDNYTLAHRYAITNAAIRGIKGEVAAEKYLLNVLHYPLTLSYDLQAQQAYFGACGVHKMVAALSEITKGNSDGKPFDTSQYTLVSGHKSTAVVSVKAFKQWLEPFTTPQVIQQLADDVSKHCKDVVDINNADKRNIPTETKVDKVANLDKLEPVNINPYYAAVVGLAAGWLRDHAPSDNTTPQEYQQAFLRDCSEAYTVTNKTAFKITFS